MHSAGCNQDVFDSSLGHRCKTVLAGQLAVVAGPRRGPEVQALCGAAHWVLTERWRVRCVRACPARRCVKILSSFLSEYDDQTFRLSLCMSHYLPGSRNCLELRTGACGAYALRRHEVRRSQSLHWWLQRPLIPPAQLRGRFVMQLRLGPVLACASGW